MNMEQMIEIYPQRPHLVILGAGASKDSMPNGDAEGRPLPVMNPEILQPIVTGLSDRPWHR